MALPTTSSTETLHIDKDARPFPNFVTTPILISVFLSTAICVLSLIAVAMNTGAYTTPLMVAYALSTAMTVVYHLAMINLVARRQDHSVEEDNAIGKPLVYYTRASASCAGVIAFVWLSEASLALGVLLLADKDVRSLARAPAAAQCALGYVNFGVFAFLGLSCYAGAVAHRRFRSQV